MKKQNSSTEEETHIQHVRSLPFVYYAAGTSAYYDAATDTYYNSFGQELRDPAEYDQHSEGYTPFGDE